MSHFRLDPSIFYLHFELETVKINASLTTSGVIRGACTLSASAVHTFGHLLHPFSGNITGDIYIDILASSNQKFLIQASPLEKIYNCNRINWKLRTTKSVDF